MVIAPPEQQLEDLMRRPRRMSFDFPPIHGAIELYAARVGELVKIHARITNRSPTPLETMPSRDAALRFTLLSCGELDQLKAQSHLVACHSYAHDVLATLSDQQLDDDFEQLVRSKRVKSNKAA